MPTRIGYGASGVDQDPEDTGACSRKRYLPGYDVGAEQLLQVVEFARKRPEIDGDRVAAIGQSFGGALSAALAAKSPRGLLGTVNFAGGGGEEGGKGEFMLIAPFGEDGHLYFSRGFASWKPLVEKFLAELQP